LPSPFAHALAGIAAGWLVDPPATAQRPSPLARVAAFAAAGAAPDLDLLVGAHRGPTHALAAAVLVGIAVWAYGAQTHGTGKHAGRIGVAVGLAYASHTLLDWLGTDTSPPIGVMALWPFSRDHYESRLHVFLSISRRYWLPEFWWGNLPALVRELVILVPAVAVAGLVRRRRRAGY
jgi:membrane-bound metal-dependent hydrolase YbcI (DUF457 family)